jgi:hypothetical protein
MSERQAAIDIYNTLTAAGWSIVWAVVGRFLYITNLIRLGKRRRFLTVQTLWELSIAVGMGVIAGGISTYFNLTGLPAAAFISAASYLGPQCIENLIGRFLPQGSKDDKTD